MVSKVQQTTCATDGIPERCGGQRLEVPTSRGKKAASGTHMEGDSLSMDVDFCYRYSTPITSCGLLRSSMVIRRNKNGGLGSTMVGNDGMDIADTT